MVKLKEGQKEHRDRKNPGEHDRQNERRRAKNAARGKQVYDNKELKWIR